MADLKKSTSFIDSQAVDVGFGTTVSPTSSEKGKMNSDIENGSEPQSAFSLWFYGKRGRTDSDIGLDLYQESLQYDPAQLEKDAAKVKRKLDFIVLPMMMFTYMLSFLDKQTLNYANAYNLQKDTGMAGTDYSWVASALYIGWLVSSYPSNLLLQRFPIGKFIGIMLFIWGVICMLQSTVFNFSGFFAIRFFLGAVEACVSPAWILLTGRLWTHEEQTFRTSLWLAMNGMSSIIGALLAYGLGHADGLALANWKLIFIVVGGMTIIWGFVIISYMPDGPHNGPMFSHYENVVLVWRVSSNKTGVAHSKFEPRQAKEAFLDIKTWLLVSTGACYGILNGGVANFISTLIKGFGFDALQSSLMQTPGGAFEIVGCVFFGWLSTKKNMTGIVICIACLPGMAGLIGIRVLPTEGYRYNLAACAWLQNIIGCPLILNWTLPSLNVSGHTKRTTAMGLYFLFYTAGNIAGPHLFLPEEAPRYPSAITGFLACYSMAIFLQAIYTTICYVENKKRDKAGHVSDAQTEALEGFEDLTDKENLHFRYHI